MNHLGTKTIETPRLLLRRSTLDDAEAMFHNYTNDPEVTKFMSWPTHADTGVSRRIIEECVSNYDKDDYYNWTIVLKDIGEPIGGTAAVQRNEDVESVQIGYCIGRKWWHQGITSEELTALVKFFFEEVGVNRIAARHDPRNPHSGNVMKKCGLKYEGTFRQDARNNQGICDSCYYAILAVDYNQLSK